MTQLGRGANQLGGARTAWRRSSGNKRPLGPARRRAQISEGPLPPSPRGHGGRCRATCQSPENASVRCSIRRTEAPRLHPACSAGGEGVFSCPFRMDATSTVNRRQQRAERRPAPRHTATTIPARLAVHRRSGAWGNGPSSGGAACARARAAMRAVVWCGDGDDFASCALARTASREAPDRGPNAKFVVFPSESAIAMGPFSFQFRRLCPPDRHGRLRSTSP